MSRKWVTTRRNGILGTIAAAAMLLGGVQADAQDEPVNLTVASFKQGSSWYVYAVNLAELLQQKLPEGSTVDSPPIAGGTGNPPLVSQGKADLAFGMAVVGDWALKGKFAFKQPLEDLRALVGGWDQYYLVPMARGDASGNLEDLFAKERPKAHVTLLSRGSIGAFGGEQLLDIAGGGEKAMEEAGGSYEFGSFDMVKTRFASGTADVFVQVGTRGHPGITEIAQATPSTFLAPSDATLEEMTKRYGWETAVLPKGTFPGQDTDIKLPGTTTTLFASTRMSDDMAYTIVKTICENAKQLQQAHKALSSFDCKTNEVWKEEVSGLPLHPGAVKYYREQGWVE